MPHLSELIVAIERCQPILNKHELNTDIQVHRVSDLDNATSSAVVFISHARYADKLAHTSAGVVLISADFADRIPMDGDSVFIIIKDAYLAYACISSLFAYDNNCDTAIHPTAIISPTATIGRNVVIAAYAVIGDYAQIGDNCRIGSHVSIAHHCVLGDDVQIHAHASIGAEGFGFAPYATANGLKWQKIYQLGKVIIGSRVRIGANTCIDRGAVGDTIIGDDVIIDNLVQIAHNVHVGDGTAIAAMVGIAGSTRIGRGCVIGGGVGIAGHLTITDGVTLTGRTFVTKSITKKGSYSSGTTAMPTNQWHRAVIKFRQAGAK